MVSSSSGSHCLFNHRLLEGLSDSSPAGSRRWSCSLPLVHWSVWTFLWLVLFSSVGTSVWSFLWLVLFSTFVPRSGLFCGWSCYLHWYLGLVFSVAGPVLFIGTSVWSFLWLVLFSSLVPRSGLFCGWSCSLPLVPRSGLFCGWSCSLHWYLGLAFSVAGPVLFTGTSLWPFRGWSCSLHWYLALAFSWLVPYAFFQRYIGLTFFSGCTSTGKSTWLFCLFVCFCFYVAGTRFPFVCFSCLLLVIYSVVHLFRPCFCSSLLCLFLSFQFFFLSDVCVCLFYFRKITEAILLLSAPACFCVRHIISVALCLKQSSLDSQTQIWLLHNSSKSRMS